MAYHFARENMPSLAYHLMVYAYAELDDNLGSAWQRQPDLREAIAAGRVSEVASETTLLQMAAVARAHDDYLTRMGPTQTVASTAVGELKFDTPKPKDPKFLSLREACNKVLHGQQHCVRIESDPQVRPYFVILGVSQDGRPWTATIDVEAFADAAVKLAAIEPNKIDLRDALEELLPADRE
ncbi:MAG: hypothetical protein H6733_07910 [Alphaproteobacteria bacterium]|nr:hypothetical protein [Alphaproteobacteria bacterium]